MLDAGRRHFITLLASGAAAWPLAARAQEAGRIYRLGFLTPAGRQTAGVLALFDELRLNGFVEERTLLSLPGGSRPSTNIWQSRRLLWSTLRPMRL